MTSQATRQVYGETLVELGRQDPNIVVLGGDLNKSTCVHLFAQEFPDRFFDLGAAEQNIMSIAAGLASAGKTVFASTFAVFGSGRPYDQIRVGIAQPHLNVKIVVTHAGLMTGEDGISAQSIEDLALMCALPGFTVVVPSDGPETAAAVKAAATATGPFYIRLSRPPTPVIHQAEYPFTLGKAEVVCPGSDVTVIACGMMLDPSIQAARALAEEEISCRIVNLATLQPTDERTISQAASETGAIVTAEEHYIHGGLNSVVAQAVTRNCPVPIEAVALTGYAESGKPSDLLEKYHLTASDIVKAVHRAIGRKKQ